MSFKICRNQNNFILKYVGIRIIQVAVASEMEDEDSFIQKKKKISQVFISFFEL